MEQQQPKAALGAQQPKTPPKAGLGVSAKAAGTVVPAKAGCGPKGAAKATGGDGPASGAAEAVGRGSSGAQGGDACCGQGSVGQASGRAWCRRAQAWPREAGCET